MRLKLFEAYIQNLTLPIGREVYELFMNFFFLVILIYVCGSLILYLISRFQYSVHTTGMRKGLYTIFLFGIILAFGLEEIEYTNWHLLFQLTVFIIFVDLSVFQTPNILKIWSAEFKHADTIAENAIENEKRLQYMNRKSNVFTTILQQAEDHLTGLPNISSKSAYEEELKSFIGQYSNQFDFSIKIYFLPNDLEDENLIKDEILAGLKQWENIFNLSYDPKQLEEAQLTLNNAQVFAYDEKHVIIPIYDGRYNLLMKVTANQEDIIEIDTTNLINLTTIFNWVV